MHVSWDHDTITQNYCGLVQFNCQLLETLANLDWVFSSRSKQMGLLICRPCSSYSSEETAMAKNQVRNVKRFHHVFLSFQAEWMNYVSNASLMTQFIPKSSSQLSRPLNWTYNIQARHFVTHSVAVFFRLLLSSPWCFSLCLDCSYLLLQHHLPDWWRTARKRERKQGFLSALLSKDTNTSWTLA